MSSEPEEAGQQGQVMNDEVLEGQLQHHWAGATAGVAFFDRVGRGFPDPEVAAEVRRLAAEVNDDRESLRQLMRSLGFEPSRLGAATARAGEWLGRFKPNGRVIRRSPLTDVLELEMLRNALSGKRIGWQVVLEISEHDDRIDSGSIRTLLDRADSHLDRLGELHLRVVLDRVVD
ncbi:hypothetical protein [Nocardioides alcanivorans]|uniref:hypothetical protein n=1 Tax=Nocardioides alcanivorans TaxID=2897352 RepID=UPI001F25CE5E|nr:hypothetical protein [Nocardioides alcanivorans]